MKTQVRISRHLILVGLILILIYCQSTGQVITRVLYPDDQIENYIPWYNPEDKITIVSTPFLDVEAVLEEDRRNSREMPRIGIKQGVEISTEDGEFIQRDNFALWSISLYSENAKSLSLRFEETYLPNDAIMYLYNEESSFLIGPISSKNFNDGTFISDYCDGDLISVLVFIPSEKVEILKVKINSLYHGLSTHESFDSDFETSGNCNVNIACEEDWDCQRESVCKILIDDSSCSGALINNDCCDLTPYILTAEHCFSIPGVNPTDWRFRFNYESPLCSPNTENHPTQWITYFGANTVSSWPFSNGTSSTDFMLVELNNSVSGIQGLSFSGWDRSSSPNHGTVTCIHHPAGDVKKISIDNETPTAQTFEWFVDDWDTGTTEGGSSGSPLFDINHRIMGIDSRGDGFVACHPDKGTFFGRFDVSWNGNGTNTTRLRNWLGTSSNPNTLNCMTNPFVDGPNIICTASELFTLNENMPCTKNITWQVAPASLFSSSTSGNGIFANLQATNSSASGNATLTYTLTANGCNDAIVEQEFWVGVPSDPTFFVQAWYDPFLQRLVLAIPHIPGATSYNWTVENQSYNNLSNFEKFHFVACPSTLDDIRFSVTAVNDCGSSSTLRGSIDRDCDKEFPIKRQASPNQKEPTEPDILVFPNPNSDYFKISIREFGTSGTFDVSISSMNGEVIKEINAVNVSRRINISDLLPGIYIVTVQTALKKYHHKFIKS